MSKMTTEEAAWIAALQKLLAKCPSKRMGSFTIGDPEIVIYDRSKEEKINAIMENPSSNSDFCNAVDKVDAVLARLRMPFQVHSTAG